MGLPSVVDLLELAKGEDPVPKVKVALEYAEVIAELRGKGYTWKGVVGWLAERGLELTVSQAAAGLQRPVKGSKRASRQRKAAQAPKSAVAAFDAAAEQASLPVVPVASEEAPHG